MSLSSRKNTFNVVVIGDSKVGKTTLIQKLCYDRLPEQHYRTETAIAHSFQLQNALLNIIEIPSDKMSVPMIHLQNANAVIVCYSESVKESYTNVTWWRKKISDDKLPIMLLDLRCDIPAEKEITNKLHTKAAEIEAQLAFNVNAHDDFNVRESFDELANELTMANEIDESLRIYNGLHESQLSFFKGDNVWDNEDKQDKKAFIAKWNEHANLAHTRTHAARELRIKYPHWDDPTSLNYEEHYINLIVAGYDYAYSKSGLFKTKVHDARKMSKYGIENIGKNEPDSRLGKLVNGLK